MAKTGCRCSHCYRLHWGRHSPPPRTLCSLRLLIRVIRALSHRLTTTTPWALSTSSPVNRRVQQPSTILPLSNQSDRSYTSPRVYRGQSQRLRRRRLIGAQDGGARCASLTSLILLRGMEMGGGVGRKAGRARWTRAAEARLRRKPSRASSATAEEAVVVVCCSVGIGESTDGGYGGR